MVVLCITLGVIRPGNVAWVFFYFLNGPLFHKRQFPTKPRELTTTTLATVEKTPAVR